jgi:hypothetical protein
MAYKHTNNATGGTMAGGHQIVFANGGTPGAAIGMAGNIWTSGVSTAATFNATSTTDGGFQGIDADTALLPSFTWTSDQNTGMWHAAADSIGFTTAGVNRLTLSTTELTSTLTVTAPNFNTTSDIRLKDNIRTFESAMDVVSQLRGVRFAWKETGVETVGLIAQEVEKVLPELIGTNADTGLKSVSYSNMVAVLIEAVKELKAEIEELKKR